MTRKLLTDFLRTTNKSFIRADRDLLTLCANLKKVGEKLFETVRIIHHD